MNTSKHPNNKHSKEHLKITPITNSIINIIINTITNIIINITMNI